MRFPDAASVAAWRRDRVSHAAFRDWVEDMGTSSDPVETVEKRLARVRKHHDPRRYTIQEVAIDGSTVRLVYEAGEDGFRDGAGDLAALLRAAAPHGAKGTFWFLGTAG